MRLINENAQNLRLARRKVIAPYLVYITGSNRNNGNPASVGFYEGGETVTLSVKNLFTNQVQNRTFYHNTIINRGSIRFASGLDLNTVTYEFSSIHSAVNLMFREYQPMNAKVEIYQRTIDPDTRKQIGIEEKFAGYVDNIEFNRPAPGGVASVSVSFVPVSVVLTVSSSLKRSDSFYKKRKLPDNREDRILRYKDGTGQWDIPWGTDERGP